MTAIRCPECNHKTPAHSSYCRAGIDESKAMTETSAARYKDHEVGTGDVCGPAAPPRPTGERYFGLDNPIAADAFSASPVDGYPPHNPMGPEPHTVEDIRREREAAIRAAFVPDQADAGPSEDAPPYCPYHDAFHRITEECDCGHGSQPGEQHMLGCPVEVAWAKEQTPDCPVCSGYPFEKHRDGCPRDPARKAVLPESALARKNLPLASGLLDYFPAALTAVAALSQSGNEQHNPGQPMHWNRAKSGDEADALLRHLIDRGTVDTDGVRHSVKAAWRALALLQKELEEAGLAPLARGAR